MIKMWKTKDKNLRVVNGFIIFICSFLFILMLNFIKVNAMPALDSKVKLSQPSGAEFWAIQQGDEWFNYVVSENNYVLTKGLDRYWCYAYKKSGGLMPLSEKYMIDKAPEQALTKDKLKGKLKNFSPSINKGTSLYKSYGIIPKASPLKSNSIEELKNYNRNLLVLMVEFNNKKFTYNENKWYDLFFSKDNKSVYSYYKEVSMGKLSFKPAEESYGAVNDGIVKVSLNRNHPNFGNDYNSYNGPQELVRDALKASDPYVDYSKFDSNKDGYISNDELHIIVIVAGYEQSVNFGKSPAIWAHRWCLERYSVNLDGMHNIAGVSGGYTMEGEIHGDHQATVGVFCHELGHDLGLPDLYDSDGSSQGIGMHSLMASGSWGALPGEYQGSTPVHLDAWSKMKLGFVKPIDTALGGTYNIKNFYTGEQTILKINTKNSNEYFLLENREFKGFDRGLQEQCKSGGIALWHIDDYVVESNFQANSVNDDENHPGVALEEANVAITGISQLKQTYNFDKLDNYFRLGLNNKFSKDTIPSSKLYDGSDSKRTLNILDYSGDNMRVEVKYEGELLKEDLNGDGVIDIKDLAVILQYYNLTSKDKGYDKRFDFNADGIIDIYDIVAVSSKIK